MSEYGKCDLCGEPMPLGEEMFKFHGYSGPCPKPPLKTASMMSGRELVEANYARLEQENASLRSRIASLELAQEQHNAVLQAKAVEYEKAMARKLVDDIHIFASRLSGALVDIGTCPVPQVHELEAAIEEVVGALKSKEGS